MDNNHIVNPLPQPLPLHLNLALMSYIGTNSWAAYQNLRNELQNLKPEQVESVSRKKLLNFIDGIAEYSAAMVDEWKPDAKIIWQEGTTRVLDYGGKGKDVVIIPPLINRANILDIGSVSLVRHLKDNGYRPLLVDWQEPGRLERNFTSVEYTRRLEEFCKTLKAKPIIVGYCMGGVFALKLATRIEPKALVLLATPYEFRNNFAISRADFEQYFDSMEFVPPEFISGLFAYADMFSVYDKFSTISSLDNRRKREFFTVEHWVNNGVPMTVPLARECIIDWVFEKNLGIEPEKIKCKTLVACAMQDKIVPLNTSLPLIAVIDNADLLKLNSGHIGIITKKLVHDPLVEWLNKI